MCLSTVYNKEKAPQNVIMSNVQRIDIEEGQVILTDLLDRQTVINGVLVMVDLVGATAIVREF